MKIIKYILFAIIGLILLFFAAGFIKPSVDYGAEITVDKPMKEAWAVAQDESKFALWLDGFKSMELIEGESGAIGSKYKVIVNPGEGETDFEMIETIVSKKEFEHIELHFDSDMMDFDQRVTHAEKDGKTTIRTESTVSAKNMMLRSMFALREMFGGAFEKQETKHLNALKKVIEENTTDYYPAPVIEEAAMPAEDTSN